MNINENGITYFASDFHLGARYVSDLREHERRVVRWLHEIAPTASRLYLLGDILDYWYEYREVVPRGFTRFFGALAELADSGVEITWLKGNHDIWTFGYLEQELGVRVHDGLLEEVIGGKRFVMEHGDGVGSLSRGFRIMRSVFRNPTAQVLFSAIHPRWTVAFAHRWSSSSRGSHSGSGGYCPFDPENDQLVRFVREYNATHAPADYFIFGHRHLVVDVPVEPHSRLMIIGDWIDHFSYATFDGSDLKMHIGAGRRPRAPHP